MFHRILLVAGLGFISLLFTSSPLLAAPLTENETLKLPGGRVVKVLSVSKIEYSKGIMALMVRYQTTLSVEAHKALSEEVDDVWKLTQKQVERLGYSEAILSSNEVTKGIFLTASREQRFIFEKGSDGKWTRLNRADFMAAQ
jgi:hypothetical protein